MSTLLFLSKQMCVISGYVDNYYEMYIKSIFSYCAHSHVYSDKKCLIFCSQFS